MSRDAAEQEGSRLPSWRGHGITGGPPSKLSPAACPSAEAVAETEERDHPCQGLRPTAGKKSFQEAKLAPWEEPSRAEMGREGQAWVPAHPAPGLRPHGTLDCRPSAPPCLPGSYRAFVSFPEPLATTTPAWETLLMTPAISPGEACPQSSVPGNTAPNQDHLPWALGSRCARQSDLNSWRSSSRSGGPGTHWHPHR